MDFIPIDVIETLPKKEQDKIKIGIIETNELSMIPLMYLPIVHSKDYYFVSYSHKDYKKVYRDIFNLESEGLNIWYDRGIPAGKDWRDIANKYIAPSSCRGILFYVSESSLISPAVIEEMKYTKLHNKSFISINIPFESDYMYDGASVKGKTFSAPKMLEIMSLNGVKVDEDIKEFINEFLNEDILYLKVDSEPKDKKEKIIANIPDLPKLKTSYKEDTNWFYIDQPSDFTIENVVEKDYEIFNTKPDAKTAVGRCAFSNCEYLTNVTLSIHSFNDYAFYNCVNLTHFVNNQIIRIVKLSMFGTRYLCVVLISLISIFRFIHILEMKLSAPVLNLNQ